ncbi:hypothetical protein [Phaeocystidibacter marisrubri]|uniref:Uncharacterized protein n=1 Tax=Phaeocystidibacter marisrubri TaxID=1577780 RepID=A0A6L3ZD93_9FLAO|nr:hypothetical protein [Phaeocystidibacter marisrubri]KAB2815616.1 hypothetical protein F8C82_07895 [Phaeocystidibacter marisrubri]GGH64817.1 hypothetical protein GCM10011318_01210 [Phaeocystidibacter marisrubri]
MSNAIPLPTDIDIEVYRTTFQTEGEFTSFLLDVLEHCFQLKISLDLEDRDKVLRIESQNIVPRSCLQKLSSLTDVEMSILEDERDTAEPGFLLPQRDV